MKNLKFDSTFVFKVKTTIGFLITLLVVGSIGWLSIKSMDESTRTQRKLASSNRELTQISNLLQLLRQAEADHYSFVMIRSDSDQMDRYTASVNSVDRSLENLKKSFEGNPAQLARLERIEPLVHEKLRMMSAVVQKHRRENPVDLKQEEFPRMDEINAGVAKIAAEMEVEENRLLADSEKLAETTAVRTRLMIVAGMALAIAIAGIAKVLWGRDFKTRKTGERLAMQLQQKALVDSQLSQMTNLLQSCLSAEEASEVISRSARHLFPNEAGTLYVFKSSRNLLEVAAEWGEASDKAAPFSVQQCWALRQGQIYQVHTQEAGVGCVHARYREPYICLPMMAHGEVLAVLHVQLCKNSELTLQSADTQGLLRVFTEHMALALSNLNLRIALRQHSIRDPLTGLFNRRYLEETLVTETERSKRDVAPFSIIMLDLDQFNRFNDKHGHEAGDAVLQTVGKYLLRHVRGGDIACRYSGEEFTMVLPGAGSQEAFQRAEQLCEGIRTLRVEFRGQVLGPLTLSAGVATYPDQGETGEHVQQAADLALYAAKADGRDRVVMSEVSETAQVTEV